MKYTGTLSNLISYILHPVIMPLAGLFLILHSGAYISGMDIKIVKILYLITGTFTLLLPLIFLPLLLYSGIIRSIRIDERRHRLIPYFITFMFYYTAHILIKKLAISSFISGFMFASAFTLLLIIILTWFFKISTHLAGIGGLAGLVLSLSWIFDVDTSWLLIIILLLSGLLASARIYLKAHKPAEVYTGFFLGFVVIFTVCSFY